MTAKKECRHTSMRTVEFYADILSKYLERIRVHAVERQSLQASTGVAEKTEKSESSSFDKRNSKYQKRREQLESELNALDIAELSLEDSKTSKELEWLSPLGEEDSGEDLNGFEDEEELYALVSESKKLFCFTYALQKKCSDKNCKKEHSDKFVQAGVRNLLIKFSNCWSAPSDFPKLGNMSELSEEDRAKIVQKARNVNVISDSNEEKTSDSPSAPVILKNPEHYSPASRCPKALVLNKLSGIATAPTMHPERPEVVEPRANREFIKPSESHEFVGELDEISQSELLEYIDSRPHEHNCTKSGVVLSEDEKPIISFKSALLDSGDDWINFLNPQFVQKYSSVLAPFKFTKHGQVRVADGKKIRFTEHYHLTIQLTSRDGTPYKASLNFAVLPGIVPDMILSLPSFSVFFLRIAHELLDQAHAKYSLLHKDNKLYHLCNHDQVCEEELEAKRISSVCFPIGVEYDPEDAAPPRAWNIVQFGVNMITNSDDDSDDSSELVMDSDVESIPPLEPNTRAVNPAFGFNSLVVNAEDFLAAPSVYHSTLRECPTVLLIPRLELSVRYQRLFPDGLRVYGPSADQR